MYESMTEIPENSYGIGQNHTAIQQRPIAFLLFTDCLWESAIAVASGAITRWKSTHLPKIYINLCPRSFKLKTARGTIVVSGKMSDRPFIRHLLQSGDRPLFW
jgi:hypothetical protein